MISEHTIKEAPEITAFYRVDEDGDIMIEYLEIHGKRISQVLEDHLLEHNGDRWCRQIGAQLRADYAADRAEFIWENRRAS